jgi:site-specific recombinase XerD
VWHFSLSTMVKSGVPLRIVSRIAGHSSYSFTWDVYGEIVPSDLSDARKKMGSLFG